MKYFIEKICDLYDILKTVLLICIILLIISFIIVIVGEVNTIWSLAKFVCFISMAISVICIIGCQVYASVKKEKLPTWINLLKVIVIVGTIGGLLGIIMDSSI